MAYVLSLMPHSPLGAPYRERQYERSWSSLGSNGTVQRHRNRQRSVGSFVSAASLYATSFRSADHTPVRSISYSELAVIRPLSYRTLSSTSRLATVPTSSQTDNQLKKDGSSVICGAFPVREVSALDYVDEEETDASVELSEDPYNGDVPMWHDPHGELTLDTGAVDVDHGPVLPSSPISSRPFRRWLSTLRRRNIRHNKLSDRPPTVPGLWNTSGRRTTVRCHRRSESWASSLDFVTAMKSATVTLASFSVGTPSRSGTRKSDHPERWHDNKEMDVRKSGDSGAPSARSVLDDALQQRSSKRREKLEELIRTEESYLADLKALSNVR